jgi:hypothetical protein
MALALAASKLFIKIFSEQNNVYDSPFYMDWAWTYKKMMDGDLVSFGYYPICTSFDAEFEQSELLHSFYWSID